MMPIGIVTRNRHKYLDVTLRSLSATRMPEDQKVVVLDDASDNPHTKRYLYTDKFVELKEQWPNTPEWKRIGLNVVRSRDKGKGLKGRVKVVRLAQRPQGVVNGSCAAIRKMMELFPKECSNEGLIMLQDDVVFNSNWMQRMVRALIAPGKKKPPIGMLCGVRLNKPIKKPQPDPFLIAEKGCTAQCYLFTPRGLDAIRDFITRNHKISRGFDNKICNAIRSGGAGVYLMHPPVCQHIGIVSMVRTWQWQWKNKKGRVGYQARGPYAMNNGVKKFL